MKQTQSPNSLQPSPFIFLPAGLLINIIIYLSFDWSDVQLLTKELERWALSNPKMCLKPPKQEGALLKMIQNIVWPSCQGQEEQEKLQKHPVIVKLTKLLSPPVQDHFWLFCETRKKEPNLQSFQHFFLEYFVNEFQKTLVSLMPTYFVSLLISDLVDKLGSLSCADPKRGDMALVSTLCSGSLDLLYFYRLKELLEAIGVRGLSAPNLTFNEFNDYLTRLKSPEQRGTILSNTAFGKRSAATTTDDCECEIAHNCLQSFWDSLDRVTAGKLSLDHFGDNQELMKDCVLSKVKNRSQKQHTLELLPSILSIAAVSVFQQKQPQDTVEAVTTASNIMKSMP